jgi:hypothetical protein
VAPRKKEIKSKKREQRQLPIIIPKIEKIDFGFNSIIRPIRKNTQFIINLILKNFKNASRCLGSFSKENTSLGPKTKTETKPKTAGNINNKNNKI